MLPSVAQQSKPFLDQMYEGGFLPLAEEANSEIVFGMIGQPWKLTGGEEPDIPNPQAFLDFDDPAFAKVAANLFVTVDGEGRTHCSTETRIHVPDPEYAPQVCLLLADHLDGQRLDPRVVAAGDQA